MATPPKFSLRYNEDVDENFLFVLKNPGLSDITIRTDDGQIFFAHRVLLAAKSTYFKTLFLGQFRDSTEKEFVLLDVDPDSFSLILDLIYGADVPIPETLTEVGNLLLTMQVDIPIRNKL